MTYFLAGFALGLVLSVVFRKEIRDLLQEALQKLNN